MARSDKPADPLLTVLGTRIREARGEHGWTRRELAERSALSSRFVSDIEAGAANVSVLKLARLAAALRIPLAQLFADVSEPGVIALLGLRGAGKSTIGPRLAKTLDLPFYELDARIEDAAGLSIAEIFSMHGEAYYRELEHTTLDTLLDETDACVLATGGGIVTNPDTFALLARSCRLVWLKASAEDHWERVVRQGDRRPMADNPQAMQQLRSLLAEREPLYAQAHLVVDTSELGLAGSTRFLTRELAPAPAR